MPECSASEQHAKVSGKARLQSPTKQKGFRSTRVHSLNGCKTHPPATAARGQTVEDVELLNSASRESSKRHFADPAAFVRAPGT